MEDVEDVPFTATQQWDELLELAQDWAKMDKHPDGSEPSDTDEESLPFIADDNEDDEDESEDDDEDMPYVHIDDMQLPILTAVPQ